MFDPLAEYVKAKYGNLSNLEVSKEEFIKLMMEQGKTRKDAELDANASMIFGSSVKIGDKMVRIKEK